MPLNAASSEARSLLRLTMRAAAHREFGPFSPATMKAISYIGAVVGGTPSILYFDWNGDVSSHTAFLAKLRFLSLLLP